jgi:hypothetical protein
VEDTKLDLALDLSDLEAEEIEVMAIADARGLPEMGASNGQTNCCSQVVQAQQREAQAQPTAQQQAATPTMSPPMQ